ncbi:MAG: response regulator transcription factor [bacterium]|nr:response regulator transcription factor [bacterium]
MKTTAVIVDDEALARSLILEYLLNHPRIEVIGQCDNGEDAIEIVDDLKPDILFLDVQMPGCNGFEVLERLDHIPIVIFSTAYSEYALKAFEVSAVDYLLKPYTRSRFDKAVSNALARKSPDSGMPTELMDLMGALGRNRSYSARLFVKTQDRMVPIDVVSIEWIGAEGDYSRIYTAEGSHLSGQGLNQFLALLDPEIFVRIHRSSIINLHFIKDIQKKFKGNYSVQMVSGATLPVGRSHLDKLKERIL